MKRIALFLSVGAAVMLLASVAMAQPDGKVDICHIPPGNPANAHTISVSENAVDAHLNHGDTACSCEVIDDCEALGGVFDEASCICATGFGDCFTNPPPGSPACLPDEACIIDAIPPDNTIGVCSLQNCTDADDCPEAPPGGTAPVFCGDVAGGDGVKDCVLLCNLGQTCPTGMVCFAIICVFE